MWSGRNGGPPKGLRVGREERPTPDFVTVHTGYTRPVIRVKVRVR